MQFIIYLHICYLVVTIESVAESVSSHIKANSSAHRR